jgi:uncharacterized protein (UPF0297 family)
MKKRRVVVVIENHSVSEVLKDDPSIDVLVIDRDTYSCDRHTRLRGVCGDDASLDAMAHGLAVQEPEKVDKAFMQVYEALKKKGDNALAERVAAVLFGNPHSVSPRSKQKQVEPAAS